MKLLPLLLGVVVLVLIKETEAEEGKVKRSDEEAPDEGGPGEGGPDEGGAEGNKEEVETKPKGEGLWTKLKGIGKVAKDAIKKGVGDIIDTLSKHIKSKTHQ